MTDLTVRHDQPSRLPRVPLAVLALTVAVVVGGRVVLPAATPGATAPEATTTVAIAPAAEAASRGGAAALDSLDLAVPVAGSGDVARIRADVDFWGARFAANPRDFISARRLAESQIDLARATGDIGAYLAASDAVDGALRANPDDIAARDVRGVVLVALHRFADARATATAVLAEWPADPGALATLGDAALEVGDLAGARDAFRRLDAVAPSAASSIRDSHLAWIEGRTTDALDAARVAVELARDEGAEGSALAWYRIALAELLIGTGDRDAAAATYAAALEDDPASHLALRGLARVAAADGRLDEAIDLLGRSIAIVPLPDTLARRADLYAMRGGPGDLARESDDRATVLAVARLAGDGATVYDRTLSLYLATSGIDPARALTLADAEIEVRKDAYGYDTLAWALLANGRATEADAAMASALAFGTVDARMLDHAGLIAAAVGDDDRARTLLLAGLALDDSVDPTVVARARTTLEGLR